MENIIKHLEELKKDLQTAVEDKVSDMVSMLETIEEAKKENLIECFKDELDTKISQIGLEEGKKDDDLPDYIDTYKQDHTLEELSELLK